MYQNGNGQRITLHLHRPAPGTGTGTRTRTDFRFQRDVELNLLHWVEDRFGCALAGRLPREQRLTLAEAVYKQADAAGLPACQPPCQRAPLACPAACHSGPDNHRPALF